MESTPAAKIKTNKPISKTKLKKTIKNVVCRPDPVEWLLATDDETNDLEAVLQKYHVNVPIYKKPHWNEIKSIPKERRPKAPKIQKVEGLLFGITECRIAIENKTCSGILIESDINPKIIAETIITQCCSNTIPYICLKGLRKICTGNFGIPSSCLGIKKDYLLDIANLIQLLFKKKKTLEIKNKEIKMDIKNDEVETMDIDTSLPISNYSYLHRTNKKVRVFSPSGDTQSNKINKFTGQNFIKLPENEKLDRKSYMNMILKRISSNPNRVKVKNKKH